MDRASEEVGWSGSARSTGPASSRDVCSGSVAPDGAAITPSTRFQASSISKTLLAVTALRAVERGRIALHAPLGPLAAEPAWTDSTLHRLLTHTSGGPHWADLPGADPAHPPAPQDLLAQPEAVPRADRVGRFHYSVIGYLLAAAALERATGCAYADLVQQDVLRPAGMRASTSGRPTAGPPTDALGHHDGHSIDPEPSLAALPGGGDLWTTTGDLTRFSAALHGGALLSAASMRLLRRPHVTLPAPARIADDRLMSTAYGYGVWLGTSDGRPALIHPGDNIGFRSLLLRRLDDAVDVAILMNDDGPPISGALEAVLPA